MPEQSAISANALVAISIGAAAIIALLILLLSLFRSNTVSKATRDEDLSIDLDKLKVPDPVPKGPQLTYYGTPVQLVVLVLAPAGRSDFPTKDQLRETVDRLIPDLSQILDWHQPVFRQWPEQLSTQGFSQLLFTNIQLPGDQGKGTPWCAITGRFAVGEGHLLAGLICRAAKPNGLSQIVVQQEGQWHDIVRVVT